MHLVGGDHGRITDWQETAKDWNLALRKKSLWLPCYELILSLKILTFPMNRWIIEENHITRVFG